MICRVKMFARTRDLAGAEEISLDLADGARVSDLRKSLAAKCPALSSLLDHCAIAVDNEFVHENTQLQSESEIALLPPVSGG